LPELAWELKKAHSVKAIRGCDRLAKQNTHVGERAFFQIAVALIPLLTFGGLLVIRPAEENRSSPRKIRAAEPLEAMGILLLGLFAVVAETTAIRGAVTGNTSTLDRLIVISMIYVGMIAIVARAARPRFARVFELTVFKGTAFEPKARRWQRSMGVGIAAMVAVTAFFSIKGLNDAIRLGEGESRLHRIEQVEVQMEASYRRLEAISRRKNAILLKLAPLSTKGTKLSRTEVVEQRILTGEFKAAVRAERLETSRLLRLVRQQNGFYEHPIPP
jgi:hypothetical protein